MKTKSKLLKVATKAVREAEKIVLKYYKKDIRSKIKKDQSSY